MPTRFLLCLIACFLSSSCARSATSDPLRVLFVGNSLTYVGNLPAAFDALSVASGQPTQSDMLVAPGGTLTARLRDGSVSRALAEKQYEVVVLQERGGDFACGYGPQVCADARATLDELAELIRSNGAKPLLLGTYQGHHQASESLVESESKAAGVAGVEYISVSNRLQELRAALPEMTWFAADGMHPGSDLTLLDALLLFERVHDARPSAVAVSMTAPIYTPASAPGPGVIAASAPAGGEDLPARHEYPSGRVAAIVSKLW